jgi:hypothetical protein
MAWTELTGYRTRSSKTHYDNDTGKFRFEVRAKTALHYPTAGADSDVLDGTTNMTPVRVNNAAFDGWRVTANTWHYALGIDKVGHPGEDGWLGFGGRQGAHWFKFRLVRAGYMKWSTREWGDIGGAPTYDRARLTRTTETLTVGPEGAEQTVNAMTTARWSDLWPALPQGQVDAVWKAEGRQLKEEIVINQAAREWITANRPPSYYFPGIQLNDAYFGFVFRLDWSDIPKAYRGMVEFDPDDDIADDGENIYLKDALDRLLAFMPVDQVYVPGAELDENGSTPLRKRIYFDGTNHYLLVGVRCDLLAGMTAGDLVFDPTFTDGYGGDVTTACDTYVSSGAVSTNYGTSTSMLIRDTRHTLVRFDLSSISADATCTSANYFHYLSAAHANDIVVNEFLIASANSGWTEAGATWNHAIEDTLEWAGGNNGCGVAGTDYINTSLGTYTSLSTDGAGQEYNHTLTAATVETLFGSAINLFSDTTSTTTLVMCTSDHATTGYRPKLVVEYTEGGTTYNQSVSGSITPAGTVVNRAGKVVSGALTSAGALINQAGKVLSGAITPDGTLSRLTSKILSGALTSSGVVAGIKTALISLAGELTSAGSLVRSTAKGLAGSITPDGGLVRAISKAVAGALTSAGGLVAELVSGVILQAVGGVLTLSGELVRQTNKSLAGALAPAGTVIKRVAVFVAGVLSSAGALVASMIGTDPRGRATVSDAIAGSATVSETRIGSGTGSDAIVGGATVVEE